MARPGESGRVSGGEQNLFSSRLAGDLSRRNEMRKIQDPRSKIQRSSKHQTSMQHSVRATVPGVWILVFLWSLGPGSWSFARAAETVNAPKPFIPSTKYATTRIAGWTVRVNRELLTTQSELGSNALALLA